MCKHSKKAAQKHAAKGDEFCIDRNITDLRELARHLTVVRGNREDAEEAVAQIDKTIKSYKRRQGLTNFPITVQNLCLAIPVLHAKVSRLPENPHVIVFS